MTRITRRKPPKRRNALATIVRRLGHGIKPSGKLYRRMPKHKNPRPQDGGFSMRELGDCDVRIPLWCTA